MPDSLKRDFAILQKYAGSYKDENVFGFVNEFIFAQGYQGFIDVIGIYFTNSFQTGLGIVTDRLTPFPPTFKFSNSDLAKKKETIKIKFQMLFEQNIASNVTRNVLYSTPKLEILFFTMLNIFFMTPPKSMTNDVYLTPIEENLH